AWGASPSKNPEGSGWSPEGAAERPKQPPTPVAPPGLRTALRAPVPGADAPGYLLPPLRGCITLGKLVVALAAPSPYTLPIGGIAALCRAFGRRRCARSFWEE